MYEYTGGRTSFVDFEGFLQGEYRYAPREVIPDRNLYEEDLSFNVIVEELTLAYGVCAMYYYLWNHVNLVTRKYREIIQR